MNFISGEIHEKMAESAWNRRVLSFSPPSFKGILIMSNFDQSSNSPDLSYGEWSGSSSDQEFKALSDNCGMTHTNGNAKTGSYSFYFSPNGEGWKLNGFRAIVVVSTKDVHDFEIFPAKPRTLFSVIEQ